MSREPSKRQREAWRLQIEAKRRAEAEKLERLENPHPTELVTWRKVRYQCPKHGTVYHTHVGELLETCPKTFASPIGLAEPCCWEQVTAEVIEEWQVVRLRKC